MKLNETGMKIKLEALQVDTEEEGPAVHVFQFKDYLKGHFTSNQSFVFHLGSCGVSPVVEMSVIHNLSYHQTEDDYLHHLVI